MVSVEIAFKRIEDQIDALSLSRAETSFISGINFPRYAASLKRGVLPKFNDLYKLCLSIGICLDDLLAENYADPASNPNNILYWMHRAPIKPSHSSLFIRLRDKVGICKLLQTLERALHDDKQCCNDVYLFILKLISLDEGDFLQLLYNNIIPTLTHLDSNAFVPTKYVLMYKTNYLPLFIEPIFNEHIIMSSLWKEVDAKLQSLSISKRDFFSATGLNSQTHKKYMDAIEDGSPSFDTLSKVLEITGITNIDQIIRTAIRNSVCNFEDSLLAMTEPTINGITFYRNNFAPEILNNISTMPNFSSLLSAILSFDQGPRPGNLLPEYTSSNFQEILSKANDIQLGFDSYRFKIKLIENRMIQISDEENSLKF